PCRHRMRRLRARRRHRCRRRCRLPCRPVHRTVRPRTSMEAPTMPDCIVAEDEELLRTSLLLQLGEVWPELRVVAECEDGASALEAIANHQPEVAFLDIRMPGLTGIQVAAALAQASPRTQVVF